MTNLTRWFWNTPPALLVLAAVFWGLNPIVGRAVHELISPLSLAFWRWVIALAVLLPFALPHLIRDLGTLRQNFAFLLALGMVGVGIFSFLVYWSLQHTTATNNLLMQATMPIMMVLMPAMLMGEKISPRFILCALLSFVGVGWIIVKGDPANFRWGEINIGDVTALCAVILYSVYATFLRKAPVVHHLSLLASLFAVGVIVLGVPYSTMLYIEGPSTPPTEAILAILYVGIFPSLISYALFNQSVALIGSSRVGPYMNLPAILGITMALPLLGESFKLYHLVGSLFVLIAIFYANHLSSRQPFASKF